MSGYVYLIKPRYRDGPFKIGMTVRDLKTRLQALQTAHYEELEVLLIIECQDPRELEQSLHRLFREYRIRGEWFAANRELYECMISMLGAYSPIGELREIGMLPNRPWHAAEHRRQGSATNLSSTRLAPSGITVLACPNTHQ